MSNDTDKAIHFFESDGTIHGGHIMFTENQWIYILRNGVFIYASLFIMWK